MRRRGGSRLAVRPAAQGWQALLLGGSVALIAFLIGTTQFYQLAYAILALLVVVLLIGLTSFRNLSFSRVLPPEARFVAGKPAKMELRISGGPRSGSRVEVVDRLPESRSFEASLPGTGYKRLIPGQDSRWKEKDEAVIGVSVRFPKRGIYVLGPAEVRMADPLGFFRFIRRFTDREEVIVYPEIYPLPGFPLGGGSVEAGTRNSYGRRGDEFAGLREYRRGDDRRHIHWKSVARTGELYVKEFAVEAPRRYSVVLDLYRRELRVPEREIEDAVSAAGSVLALLHEDGLPSRLVCAGSEVISTEFGSDEVAYWEVMRILATVSTSGREDLGEVLHGDRNLGDGVILISRSREDGGLVEEVRRLREAGLSVTVVAVASHTYRGYPGPTKREAEFMNHVGSLENAGATVRTMRYPEGVSGLAGTKMRSMSR